MKIDVPGYQIKEELFRSSQTIIYRALLKKDKTSDVLNVKYRKGIVLRIQLYDSEDAIILKEVVSKALQTHNH